MQLSFYLTAVILLCQYLSPQIFLRYAPYKFLEVSKFLLEWHILNLFPPPEPFHPNRGTYWVSTSVGTLDPSNFLFSLQKMVYSSVLSPNNHILIYLFFLFQKFLNIQHANDILTCFLSLLLIHFHLKNISPLFFMGLEG